MATPAVPAVTTFPVKVEQQIFSIAAANLSVQFANGKTTSVVP